MVHNWHNTELKIQVEMPLPGGHNKPPLNPPTGGRSTAHSSHFTLTSPPFFFHRMTEWLGWKGTWKIIKFQFPCSGQGCHPLDQLPSNLPFPTSSPTLIFLFLSLQPFKCCLVYFWWIKTKLLLGFNIVHYCFTKKKKNISGIILTKICAPERQNIF